MKSSEYFYVNRNNFLKEFDNAEVFKKVIVEFLKINYVYKSMFQFPKVSNMNPCQSFL